MEHDGSKRFWRSWQNAGLGMNIRARTTGVLIDLRIHCKGGIFLNGQSMTSHRTSHRTSQKKCFRWTFRVCRLFIALLMAPIEVVTYYYYLCIFVEYQLDAPPRYLGIRRIVCFSWLYKPFYATQCKE